MTGEQGLPLEEYHRAGHEVMNGNPEVYKDALLPPRRCDTRQSLRSSCPRLARGLGEVGSRRRELPEWRSRRIRKRVHRQHSRTRLHRRGRELPGAGRRSGRDRPGGSSGHNRFSGRGRLLEGDAQARRSNHEAAPAGIGPPDIAARARASLQAPCRVGEGTIELASCGNPQARIEQSESLPEG